MKSTLFACLIAIALLTSCSKDNPVDPNTDPKTITTVNAYIVKFNAMTSDWDISTKTLAKVVKLDNKGNYNKRIFNENFTSNPNTIFSFLLSQPVAYFSMLNNSSCVISDSTIGETTTYYTYDESGYITGRSEFKENSHNGLIYNFNSLNGKISSFIQNMEPELFYEYGSNGFISKTYILTNGNEKTYQKHYFHDSKGNVTEIIDSSDASSDFIQKVSFKYDNQNRMTELKMSLILGNDESDYTSNFFYDSNGLIIKVVTSASPDGIDATEEFIYDTKMKKPIEIIYSSSIPNFEKQKLILEYKNE